LLSACGGSAKAGSPTTGASTETTTAAGSGPGTTTAGGANSAALQAYQACLTQNGVTIPTRPSTAADATTVAGQRGGGFGGGSGSLQGVIADPANKAAVDACASLLPPGGFTGGGGGGNAGGSQALQAYDSCLSDNGVTVPTTVAGGPPPSIDRTSPAFAAANEKCQALLPQRGANASATTTTVAG
jgi:hypothetical protein